MKLCRVLGNVVSTVKHPTHLGEKIMLVQPIDERGADQGASFVAIDRAQAGPGDVVLVNQEGNGARQLYGVKILPIRSLILAIVDHVEPDEASLGGAAAAAEAGASS